MTLRWTPVHQNVDGYEEWTATDVPRAIVFTVCPSPDGRGGWNRSGWRLFRRGFQSASMVAANRLYPDRNAACDAAEPSGAP